MKANTTPESSTPLEDDRHLFRIMLWGYLTGLPGIVMFVVTAVLSGSVALGVYAVQYPIDFAVQTFSLYAIRQSIGRNTLRYPYGSGKLENFSAFLSGVLNVPCGLYLIYHAITCLVTSSPVSYTLSMAPLVYSVVREVILYLACLRLARTTMAHSPVLHSYTIGYRLGFLSDAGLMVAFFSGWLLIHLGLPEIGNRIDPAIGLMLAAYMVWVGAGLVWNNFRALMDLPLSEEEQLRIIKILAAHYADYENLGNIFTRSSGKVRYVELELMFPAGRTIGEIQALSAVMARELAEELPGLNFKIIPVVGSGMKTAPDATRAGPPPCR
ncbi:MAG: cation transporter [Verrucomicrobia bacterium]|nr:cation transporter [Verrucomicrobiota bacterium]